MHFCMNDIARIAAWGGGGGAVGGGGGGGGGILLMRIRFNPSMDK